jgi:hypothetical protein
MYLRPYCEHCNLVYSALAFGVITHCTQCAGPLSLKSFNPWPKIGGGIALISVGLITIFFNLIPIVWIGAFIWGGSLIYNGNKKWSQIRKLDRDAGYEFRDYLQKSQEGDRPEIIEDNEMIPPIKTWMLISRPALLLPAHLIFPGYLLG